MKVKVNFKKPTVLLTAEKYSSMLEEMASLRQGLDQYKSWCENMNVSLTDARDQADALRGAVACKDAEVIERNALIQELNDQIEASETARKDAEDALEIAKKNATLREMGWDMLHKQIDELQRKNRGLQAENLEAHALIAKLNDQIEASESAQDGEKDSEAYITELKFQVNVLTRRLEESESKREHNAALYETASRAATELADMLIRANEETKAARAEAEDTELELMDREFRINELEKQVEWLRDKNDEWAQVADRMEKENVSIKLECDRWKRSAAENVEMAKDFHHQATEAEVRAEGLRKTIDEIYEKEADFCAEAQFERERADQLEEANKKLYAQVLAQRDAIERLQCQHAADEEDYNTLKGMYDELHMAAQDLVIHIRK